MLKDISEIFNSLRELERMQQKLLNIIQISIGLDTTSGVASYINAIESENLFI
jgi:hypothetical protein